MSLVICSTIFQNKSEIMKENIYIKDFINLLFKYKKPLIIIMGISLLSLIQLSFILPKSYKSEFALNIYSKYFSNALISDLVPGVNSTPEMTQTVDSMVREVMNDEFIDEIGNKYNIYPKNIDNFELARQRQMLRDQFEMFGAGGNAYQIGFIYKDPNTTYEVAKLVLERVKSHFINTRLKTIEIAQDTIQKKLESANVTDKFSGKSGSNIISKNPTVLQAEINKIDQEISSLKMQFNVNHPSIVALTQRRKTIAGWLKEISNTTEATSSVAMGATGNVDNNSAADVDEEDDSRFAPLLTSSDKETSKNITAKLYANFNNINIALDIERKSLESYIGVTHAPQYPTSVLFPKKRLFASLGFVLGLIFCFIYVFVKEVLRGDPLVNAEYSAREHHVKFFGVLPKIDEENLMTNKVLMIEDKRPKLAIEYRPENAES